MTTTVVDGNRLPSSARLVRLSKRAPMVHGNRAMLLLPLFKIRPTRLIVSMLVLACAWLIPAQTSADESPLQREVGDYLLHGDTDAALRVYLQAARSRATGDPNAAQLQTAPWTDSEALGLVQIWLTRGQAAFARAVLAPHVQGTKATADALLAWAEIERVSGTAPDRLRFLLKAAQAHPKHLPLRVALGAQLYQLGKAVEARKLLDPLADLYQDGKVTETRDKLAVAESLALNGYYKDALQVLLAAKDGTEGPIEAVACELALGQLYLAKYNYRDADVAFKAVLAINPHDAAALCGMARIDLASDGDIAKARKRLDELLTKQPGVLEAMALRADVALHDEDVATAKRMAKEGLTKRVDFQELLYIQGAAAKVSDDEALWAVSDKAVRTLNPSDGQLHLTAAAHLEMAHRYREVRELLQEALKRDPELWPAHAALGVAYARIADDAKAKKELELAYGGDPYDVRTSNQLSILYDDVLKNMVLLPGSHVDLRLHKKERKALERAVLPFLQEAVQTLTKAYGFGPERPLQVEIFPEVQQFAVRTVGLPQMGAHAVCFGHLVTSRSPMADPFNWKMVLFHELSHVYHIQASDGRVPRWLTEGLAMMETVWADPRWRQGNDRRAWDRLTHGRLANLDKFNLAFSQARSMQDILDAYDQSMREVEFLADKFGRDKVRKLSLLHKSGKPTAELIQQVYGVSSSVLDNQFAAWLGDKLGHYAKDFRVDAEDLAKKFKVILGADAKSPLSQFATALVALRAGDLGRAKELLLTLALAVPDPKGEDLRPIVQYLLLDMALKTGSPDPAKPHAQWLVDQPDAKYDGIRQRLVLFHLAKSAGEAAKATVHLRAALAIAPRDGQVLLARREVADLATSALLHPDAVAKQPWLHHWVGGNEGSLRAELADLAGADPHDQQAPVWLAQVAWQLVLATRNKSPKDPAARDLALAQLRDAAAWIEERDPACRAAPLFEARAQWSNGAPRQALAAYRIAAERSSNVKERAEVWCEAAQAAQEAGSAEEQAEARRHCEAARPPAAGGAPSARTSPK